MYNLMYPNASINPLSAFAKCSRTASVKDDVYGSKSNARENNIVINAYWPSSGQDTPIIQANLPLSVGQIQRFILHFSIDGLEHSHLFLFAHVRWFKRHPKFNWFGTSAAHVSHVDFEPVSPYCYIPIQHISSLCVFSTLTLRFDNNPDEVIVSTPTSNKHIYI